MEQWNKHSEILNVKMCCWMQVEIDWFNSTSPNTFWEMQKYKEISTAKKEHDQFEINKCDQNNFCRSLIDCLLTIKSGAPLTQLKGKGLWLPFDIWPRYRGHILCTMKVGVLLVYSEVLKLSRKFLGSKSMTKHAVPHQGFSPIIDV